MYPFYLGIDLHLKRTYLVLMDNSGTGIDERQIQNLDITQYLQEHVPRETYAVLEATRNWTFMYDILAEHVERVELAHPKELKAIASAAVKTDQIDAKVLANLARLNFLPISYAAPKETRDLRLYTRHREWLVRQRTQATSSRCSSGRTGSMQCWPDTTWCHLLQTCLAYKVENSWSRLTAACVLPHSG